MRCDLCSMSIYTESTKLIGSILIKANYSEIRTDSLRNYEYVILDYFTEQIKCEYYLV